MACLEAHFDAVWLLQGIVQGHGLWVASPQGQAKLLIASMPQPLTGPSALSPGCLPWQEQPEQHSVPETLLLPRLPVSAAMRPIPQGLRQRASSLLGPATSKWNSP